MLSTLLQALISGLAIGSTYALVALGFSITFTTTRTLNFGAAELVSASTFVGMSVLLLLGGLPVVSTTFGSYVPSGWAQLAALLVTLTAMGLVGCLMYWLAVRPFAGKPGLAWVMSTLGFGIVLQSVGLAIWGPKPVAVPGPIGDEVIRIAGIGIRRQEVLLLVSSVAVMLVVDGVMQRTRVGKIMRAVAYSAPVASLMGINVPLVMVGAFFVSSALGGLAGFLLAPIAQASLFIGVSVGLKGFSGAMLGGLNSPRGCVFGGFALGVLEALVNLWDAQWREVAVFLVVILVLAWKPKGLFGMHMAEKV